MDAYDSPVADGNSMQWSRSCITTTAIIVVIHHNHQNCMIRSLVSHLVDNFDTSITVVCIQPCRAYAWSYGPLAWLYPSEIQPLETRSAGLAVASFSNLLFSFVIAQTFLTMLCALQVTTHLYVQLTVHGSPLTFLVQYQSIRSICCVFSLF